METISGCSSRKCSMKICVFIDSAINNCEYLIKNVFESVEVVQLNNSQDSIQQVADYLRQRREIQEVHLISHGASGCLKFAKSQLDLENLENYHQLLKQSFSAVDSLILYGCHLAQGEKGQTFIKQLHQITATKIAASTSLTGNKILGGNWDFEFTLGNLNVNLPFNPEALQSYPSILATFIVNSTGDTNDNDISNGITTLREAITVANITPGADRIDFNIPNTDPGFNATTNSFTILPLSRLPAITDSVVIDATTQTGFTGTPIIEINGTNAAGLDDGVIEITAGENSIIRGFVINRAGFSNAAILINNSNANQIENNYLGTDITGTVDPGGNGSGIIILNSANNIIRDNLISGNNNTSAVGIRIEGNTATNNQILGNFIGTTITGNAALANSGGGIVIENAPNNIIGGTTASDLNINSIKAISRNNIEIADRKSVV